MSSVFLPFQIILQTAFFTMAFHEHHLEAFITVIRRWTPESLNLGGILHVALVQVKTKVDRKRIHILEISRSIFHVAPDQVQLGPKVSGYSPN